MHTNSIPRQNARRALDREGRIFKSVKVLKGCPSLIAKDRIEEQIPLLRDRRYDFLKTQGANSLVSCGQETDNLSARDLNSLRGQGCLYVMLFPDSELQDDSRQPSNRLQSTTGRHPSNSRRGIQQCAQQFRMNLASASNQNGDTDDDQQLAIAATDAETRHNNDLSTENNVPGESADVQPIDLLIENNVPGESADVQPIDPIDLTSGESGEEDNGVGDLSSGEDDNQVCQLSDTHEFDEEEELVEITNQQMPVITNGHVYEIVNASLIEGFSGTQVRTLSWLGQMHPACHLRIHCCSYKLIKQKTNISSEKPVLLFLWKEDNLDCFRKLQENVYASDVVHRSVFACALPCNSEDVARLLNELELVGNRRPLGNVLLFTKVGSMTKVLLDMQLEEFVASGASSKVEDAMADYNRRLLNWKASEALRKEREEQDRQALESSNADRQREARQQQTFYRPVDEEVSIRMNDVEAVNKDASMDDTRSGDKEEAGIDGNENGSHKEDEIREKIRKAWERKMEIRKDKKKRKKEKERGTKRKNNGRSEQEKEQKRRKPNEKRGQNDEEENRVHEEEDDREDATREKMREARERKFGGDKARQMEIKEDKKKSNKGKERGAKRTTNGKSEQEKQQKRKKPNGERGQNDKEESRVPEKEDGREDATREKMRKAREMKFGGDKARQMEIKENKKKSNKGKERGAKRTTNGKSEQEKQQKRKNPNGERGQNDEEENRVPEKEDDREDGTRVKMREAQEMEPKKGKKTRRKEKKAGTTEAEREKRRLRKLRQKANKDNSATE